MTTQEIAEQLVKLCREGKFAEVQQELYSEDVVSIEIEGAPNPMVKGIEAVNKKGKEWDEMVQEVHSSEISDPLIAGDFFTITMKTNITMKGAPGPVQMDEICLYEVKNNKIIKEQFFYSMEEEMA